MTLLTFAKCIAQKTAHGPYTSMYVLFVLVVAVFPNRVDRITVAVVHNLPSKIHLTFTNILT